MKKLIRSIILISFLGIYISCASTKTSPVNNQKTNDSKIVETKSGLVQGLLNEDGTVEIFAGIPFAQAPVGNLRWKEPQDIIPWEGIYSAQNFAPMAMQNTDNPIYHFLFNLYCHSKNSRTYGAPMSEDCLYLNIWKPVEVKSDSKAPVLVYIHGGSLLSGQSWYEKYDGENLAKEGIIVVTISYRLGVFGYFADEDLAKESPNGTTGNYGLLDQIKALEWIHSNIEAFGGNAGNITIAGESAGSSSVNAICASPLAKGLFNRAIAESSSVIQQTPPHTFRTMAKAMEMGNNIKVEFKCKDVNELRKIPAKKLLKTKYANNSMTVDGYALPKTPYEIYKAGENNEEALLNGFNAREGFGFAFFTKVTKKNLPELLESSFKDKTAEAIAAQNITTNKQAKLFYNDVFSAVCFTYPHDCWTKTVAAQGKPVYEYFFSKENGEIGTNHSGEMIYAYKNVPKSRNYDSVDYELETIMSSYWLNFVRTGNPNGKATDGSNLPLWETFNESRLLMELGEKCYMRTDPFSSLYQYFPQ